VNRFFEVIYIEIRTNEDLLNGDLFEPSLELALTHTILVVVDVSWILGASLVVERDSSEDRGVPIALDGDVLIIRAEVIFNAIFFDLIIVLVEEVDAKLALGYRYVVLVEFALAVSLDPHLELLKTHKAVLGLVVVALTVKV
jgi:hypothetical protein